MEFDANAYAEMMDKRKKTSVEQHRRAKPVKSDVSGLLGGDGSLLFNGEEVDGGDAKLSMRGRDAVQLPSGGTEHLTRGKVKGSPEMGAANLEFDRIKQRWFRLIGGKRYYE